MFYVQSHRNKTALEGVREKGTVSVYTRQQ